MVKISLVLWNVACIMFCMSWRALVFTQHDLPKCTSSNRCNISYTCSITRDISGHTLNIPVSIMQADSKKSNVIGGAVLQELDRHTWDTDKGQNLGVARHVIFKWELYKTNDTLHNSSALCVIKVVKISLVLWSVACIKFCMSWQALVLADDLVPWLFRHPVLPECTSSNRC